LHLPLGFELFVDLLSQVVVAILISFAQTASSFQLAVTAFQLAVATFLLAVTAFQLAVTASSI